MVRPQLPRGYGTLDSKWSPDHPPGYSLPYAGAHSSPNAGARSSSYAYKSLSRYAGGQQPTAVPPFQYERLNYDDDEIRLLQVNLANDTDYGLVSHVSLRKSKPQYTALSYTWGDQTSLQTITINGMSKSVSLNLCQALTEVDQLCINQANDEEKNHQVALMQMIYDRAEEVLIWLPVNPPFSSFNPANGISGAYRFGRPGYADWSTHKPWLLRNLSVPSGNEGYQRHSPLIYRQISHSYQDDMIKAWTDICAILQSPWWRRAWVYQEFVFATRATFLIGGYSVPWRELYELLNGSMSHFDAHTAFWKSVRDEIELSLADWNSRIKQSRMKNASAIENQTNDGDCCIYCGESCASLNRCSNRWLKCNNTVVPGFLDITEKFLRKVNYGHSGSGQVFAWVCGFLLGLAALITTITYYTISGLVAWLCYVVSNREWNCDHKRPSISDRESAQRELQDLEREFAKAWRDPAASQQAVQSHHARSVEAHEAWELTRFFFSSKVDIATAFLPLSRLVKFSRNSYCADPRDHIFAFLSLTDASYDLQASYGNTIHMVLVEAVSAIITVEKSLNVLSLASEDRNVRNDGLRSLPSWVPWLCEPEDKSSEYNRFLRVINFPSELCKATKEQACVVSFLPEGGSDFKDVLKVRGIRVNILSRVVEDPPRQVWRRFDGNSIFQFITRHTARPGDEIWVLFRLDTPLALSRPSKKDDFYTIIGPAMVQEAGEMSDVMTGSLIDKLEQGQVSTEDICII